MLNYSKLQNGSDIRGVALEGKEEVNLGKEETLRLTASFAKWLSGKENKPVEELKISIGHDSRLTAKPLKNAAVEALTLLGATVLDCGLASTPAMFMSTVFDDTRCDGAIMITASHLPENRNGFKYFSKEGGLDKSDIREIISIAETLDLTFTKNGKPCVSSVKSDLMDTYATYLRDKIKKEVGGEEPLKGLKIVVDAGNGAGGFYAYNILKPLGADISGSQFLEPDGRFPNHQPNPENKEAMASICRAVKENNADLGIIFDTDVDRSSAVDAFGKEINRNAIVAMAAALIAAEHPGTTVVTDSITSDQLTEYLEKCLGLKHLRFKRGYKNVINKAIELNEQGTDSQLAIETSGHAAYKDNYFLDDGAYLATKIVIKTAQLKQSGVGLDVVLSSLKEPIESVEYRFSVNRDDFGDYAEKIIEDLRVQVSQKGKEQGIFLSEPNYEGVRINFDRENLKGWCLLRKSLHDPKMPLNIEVTKGNCREILNFILEFAENYDISL
ncbi:MAG: phosphomannomutase/phosphoglucomutase [Clostridiales bacterium]|nr:phosphomannomutase/phosphoglucomutase [Bacillota bacterium]MEE0516519.1 hypothetical protein [Anaerovoracaceae bacterium]PWL94210.1 MAG: phosphomannomutase/phosphoglucomutase [Clostridiales bacterium]